MEKLCLSVEKLIDLTNKISKAINIRENIQIYDTLTINYKELEKPIVIDFKKITKIKKEKLEDGNGINIWCVIVKNSSEDYEITYNSNIKYFSKQIFTISHEYVHFILDQLLEQGVCFANINLKNMEIGKKYFRGNGEYEYIIEKLSSKLIVNDEDFANYVNARKFSSSLIIDIANKFDLSLSAAEIRYEDTYYDMD